MIEELKEYYREQGISAMEFSCEHYDDCKRGCKVFVTAAEAQVGTEYEKRTLPRVLFVSLDSGELVENPAEKTVEYSRNNERLEKLEDAGPRNRHWFQTLELAHRILNRFDKDLEFENIISYIAHTNSAKCCQNKEGKVKADKVLFNNCKRYLRGEISILDPDIIVTQGDEAWDAITHNSKEQEVTPSGKIYISYKNRMKNAYIKNGVVNINDRDVLWFHSYHPRFAGCYWHQKRACHRDWVDSIYNHMRSHKGDWK